MPQSAQWHLVKKRSGVTAIGRKGGECPWVSGGSLRFEVGCFFEDQFQILCNSFVTEFFFYIDYPTAKGFHILVCAGMDCLE